MSSKCIFHNFIKDIGVLKVKAVLVVQYINFSQIHECGIWERGRTVSFLGIFVSNFRYSVFRVKTANIIVFCVYFLGGLVCVRHSFAYVILL